MGRALDAGCKLCSHIFGSGAASGMVSEVNTSAAYDGRGLLCGCMQDLLPAPQYVMPLLTTIVVPRCCAGSIQRSPSSALWFDAGLLLNAFETWKSDFDIPVALLLLLKLVRAEEGGGVGVEFWMRTVSFALTSLGVGQPLEWFRK